MEKESINGKRRARKLALQALYQWLMSGSELYEIEAQFRVANNMEKVDGEYFSRLLHGVAKHCVDLDAAFLPLLVFLPISFRTFAASCILSMLLTFYLPESSGLSNELKIIILTTALYLQYNLL